MIDTTSLKLETLHNLNIRTSNIVVSRTLKNNRIFNMPTVPHSQIIEALNLAIDRYNNESDWFVAQAKFHIDFVAIHPQRDGNGHYIRQLFVHWFEDKLHDSIDYLYYNNNILRGCWKWNMYTGSENYKPFIDYMRENINVLWTPIIV